MADCEMRSFIYEIFHFIRCSDCNFELCSVDE
jgi:hypothetical protein